MMTFYLMSHVVVGVDYSVYLPADLPCQLHKYPVTLSPCQIFCAVVPASLDSSAQSLICATYSNLAKKKVDKIIFLTAHPSPLVYGLTISFDQLNVCNNFILPAYRNLIYIDQTPFYHNDHLAYHAQLLESFFPGKCSITLLVGALSADDISRLVNLLQVNISENILCIIAADIGCYQGLPNQSCFHSSKLCQIYQQDALFIRSLQSGYQYERMPCLVHSVLFDILSALLLSKGYQSIESYLVGYDSSCSDEADTSCIATYAALIFQTGVDVYTNHMTVYEQRQLMKIARQALQDIFMGHQLETPCMISFEMNRPYGLFASLYAMSDHGLLLKGCMGNPITDLPLYKMTYQMTQQAATKDRRFYPVREKDLHATLIFLSIIVDMQQIDQDCLLNYSSGLMMKFNAKTAYWLPHLEKLEKESFAAQVGKLARQVNCWQDGSIDTAAQLFSLHCYSFQEE